MADDYQRPINTTLLRNQALDLALYPVKNIDKKNDKEILELAKITLNDDQLTSLTPVQEALFPPRNEAGHISKDKYLETVKEKIKKIVDLNDDNRNQIIKNIEKIAALRKTKEKVIFVGFTGFFRKIWDIIKQISRGHGFNTKAQWEKKLVEETVKEIKEQYNRKQVSIFQELDTSFRNVISLWQHSAIEYIDNEIDLLDFHIGKLAEIFEKSQLSFLDEKIESEVINVFNKRIDLIKNFLEKITISKQMTVEILTKIEFFSIVADDYPNSLFNKRIKEVADLCNSFDFNNYQFLEVRDVDLSRSFLPTPNALTDDQYVNLFFSVANKLPSKFLVDVFINNEILISLIENHKDKNTLFNFILDLEPKKIIEILDYLKVKSHHDQLNNVPVLPKLPKYVTQSREILLLIKEVINNKETKDFTNLEKANLNCYKYIIANVENKPNDLQNFKNSLDDITESEKFDLFIITPKIHRISTPLFVYLENVNQFFDPKKTNADVYLYFNALSFLSKDVQKRHAIQAELCNSYKEAKKLHPGQFEIADDAVDATSLRTTFEEILKNGSNKDMASLLQLQPESLYNDLPPFYYYLYCTNKTAAGVMFWLSLDTNRFENIMSHINDNYNENYYPFLEKMYNHFISVSNEERFKESLKTKIPILKNLLVRHTPLSNIAHINDVRKRLKVKKK